MTNTTKLEEYFKVGCLYEVSYRKLSGIGIDKKVYLLKRIDKGFGGKFGGNTILAENIENGWEEWFAYEDYNIDILKKIS